MFHRAFSVIETIESALSIETGTKPQKLSVQQLISCETGSGLNGCQGGEILDAFDRIIVSACIIELLKHCVGLSYTQGRPEGYIIHVCVCVCVSVCLYVCFHLMDYQIYLAEFSINVCEKPELPVLRVLCKNYFCEMLLFVMTLSCLTILDCRKLQKICDDQGKPLHFQSY